MQAMLRGDFEAAWCVCDDVQKRRRDRGETCAHLPRHEQFLWDGTPPTGKRVRVLCFHGLGDTLQFVRLLPLLRRRTAHVTLCVQPQLITLLDGTAGVDQLLDLDDGNAQSEHDLDIELMELPHLLRLQLADIPQHVPYLSVPRLEHFPDVVTIGLACRSGPWNPDRTIDVQLLAPLLNIESLRWYSLDFPATAKPPRMASLACEDIRRMACRMTALDLVITVDTMQAHLAGALGLPTWLLLPTNADWRWMRDRTDSPWYPTMRLFRQDRAGDWQSVVDQVRGALNNLIRARDIRSSGYRAFSG